MNMRTLWKSTIVAAYGLLSLSMSARSFSPRPIVVETAGRSAGMPSDTIRGRRRRRPQVRIVLHSTPGDVGGGGKAGGFSSNRASAKARHGYAIPLIGPIPNARPLLPGGTLALDPPTPLQWKALEESVVVHRNFLKGQEAGGEDGSAAVGIIDAAPLVAVIDNYSGLAPTGTLGSNAGERGRYATLAAVVGISSKGGNRDGTSTRSNDDAENNFADSFMRFGVDDDMISPFSSTVRLVGVGRAVLRDFFYKTPTLLHPEARLGEAASGGSAEWHVEDEDDEDEWDDGYADSTPIVMAEFTTLRDASTLSYGDSEKLGTKGARSARTSPVHAVAELHRVSNQVGWMHDSRRRLAAGLTAAKARLELRGKRKMWEGEDARAQEEEYEYDDYDGIGLTGSGFSTSVAQWEDDADDIMSVEELLIKFHKQNSNEEEERSEAAASPEIEGRDLPSSLSRVAEMENYGLNYYSYFSSIPDLTSVALNTLEPYYSKEYREKEEHELQVFSFIAFRSLEGYADPMDLAWSLHCQSTIERLHRAYDIMLLHRRELEDIAEKISQELADCGEECTDLW